MNTTFATILEIVGTLAFAISGIRLAAAKQFDWFGAYAVGLVTAIGGGTLRDVLLNATPFWMINGSYLTVTAIALIFVIIFKQYLVKLENTFFIFDTIGLALFVVVGVEKTLMFGFPFWVAIVMGTITGSVGSIIRDILINEEPLLFRKDILCLSLCCRRNHVLSRRKNGVQQYNQPIHLRHIGRCGSLTRCKISLVFASLER